MLIPHRHPLSSLAVVPRSHSCWCWWLPLVRVDAGRCRCCCSSVFLFVGVAVAWNRLKFLILISIMTCNKSSMSELHNSECSGIKTQTTETALTKKPLLKGIFEGKERAMGERVCCSTSSSPLCPVPKRSKTRWGRHRRRRGGRASSNLMRTSAHGCSSVMLQPPTHQVKEF